jgi:hypothetical protein
MKSKKSMYVLLPVVLGIWGTIGWKIYTGLQDKTQADAAPQKAASLLIDDAQADSIPLVAQYRDPFLDGSVAPRVQHASQDQKKQGVQANPLPKQTLVETPAQWPQIAYNGLIKRNGEEKVVGFLNVDGQSHFVKPGDKAGAVTVVKLWKDSIQVSWNKLQRVIRK